MQKRQGVLWSREIFGLSFKVERGPTELEGAFRRGWQKGVFVVLDHVQTRMREIREAAVKEALARQDAEPEMVCGPMGAEVPKANVPFPARFEMHLDELRTMVENVLRSPERGR